MADLSKELSKELSKDFAYCSDTISRKAAIDALAEMMPRSYTPDGSHPADEEIFRVQEIFADCIKTLEILPSAQPEIIRCEDCMYNGSFDTDCPISWNGKEYCSFAKRRTDD